VAVLDEIRADGTRLAGPTVPWSTWVQQAVDQGDAAWAWRKSCHGAEKMPTSSRPCSWSSFTLGRCTSCQQELRIRKDGRTPKHGADVVIWHRLGKTTTRREVVA
jgi:hypothetical protein